MCEHEHPYADAVGAAHDHEQAAEDQLDAAGGDPENQALALELARIEAQLALAKNVGRIADVVEKGGLTVYVYNQN